MKKNDFFETMGNVDAELIERADKQVTVRSRRPIMKIAAIAASFAILVAGLVAVLPMLLGGEEPITQDVIVWDDIFTMFSPGNGDGLTVGENNGEEEIIITETAFAEIVSEGFSDYEIGMIIPTVDANIGEKLGEVDVRSGWFNRTEKVEKDVAVVRAEVYEIVGVSRKAAVAIRYLEKCAANSDYYSYCYYYASNKNYELTTLSKCFADLNADAYMRISDQVLLVEVSADAELKIEKYKFKDGAGEEMRELILSLDGDGEVVGYYDEAGVTLKKGTKMLEFTVRLNTSKKGMSFLYVFENGSIAIEGLGDGIAVFNVGVEATDAIFAVFAENAERDAGEYGEDDLVEATTGEVKE